MKKSIQTRYYGKGSPGKFLNSSQSCIFLLHKQLLDNKEWVDYGTLIYPGGQLRWHPMDKPYIKGPWEETP